MKKLIPLNALQELARQMTFTELAHYEIPEVIRTQLMLGIQFDGAFRIFELYIPGEKPSDAQVISRARLNVNSGEGQVEIFGLKKK